MGRTRKQTKKESNEDEAPQPEAPKAEKTQPIDKKPKKYIQKSIDAIQRIERSKYEKIFLLSAERLEQNWKFMVQGVFIISKLDERITIPCEYINNSCMHMLRFQDEKEAMQAYLLHCNSSCPK